MSSSPSSIPILPTRPPSPPGWSSCAPNSAPSGSPRCAAASASPRPRSLPGWASPRAACPRSSTPSQAPPNCAPWPPTSKPSAAAWRSSPTSATSGSPSPNPAPRQPNLISTHDLAGNPWSRGVSSGSLVGGRYPLTAEAPSPPADRGVLIEPPGVHDAVADLQSHHVVGDSDCQDPTFLRRDVRRTRIKSKPNAARSRQTAPDVKIVAQLWSEPLVFDPLTEP